MSMQNWDQHAMSTYTMMETAGRHTLTPKLTLLESFSYSPFEVKGHKLSEIFHIF